ncbi:MAG: prepilin-type N-terminal cleavage/methylation domain-containing protein [Acidobacteria bacterium]|nr:prepilin-type N-terminal cleavage/methylation domain-containing protein [Acidobacteriota bacterium]
MTLFRRLRSRGRGDGYSFVELIVVSALLVILASAAVPLATVTMQRQREVELRRTLRELRTAIDRYKDAVDLGTIRVPERDIEAVGYPPDLETLVTGEPLAGEDGTGRLRFLRRVPLDPITRSREWGLRSYQDEPDARRWGGGNVYDVFSLAQGTALDGTRYRNW